MAHQFLLNSDGSTRRVQQRPIGMPQRVPAQVDGLTVYLQANFPTSGLQVILLNFAGVVGRTGHRTGKDPVSGRDRPVPIPYEQVSRKSRIESAMAVRIL